jgi:hypothetical protein
MLYKVPKLRLVLTDDVDTETEVKRLLHYFRSKFAPVSGNKIKITTSTPTLLVGAAAGPDMDEHLEKGRFDLRKIRADKGTKKEKAEKRKKENLTTYALNRVSVKMKELYNYHKKFGKLPDAWDADSEEEEDNNNEPCDLSEEY